MGWTEYNKTRTIPEGRAKRRIERQAYRNANREKYRAHANVYNAIREGRLKRQPCEVCGAKKVHAHHDDYSKPLAVRWLCHNHHSAIHGR